MVISRLARSACKAVATAVLAATCMQSVHAKQEKQLDVFVLPDGFRIEMAYIPTTQKLIDVIATGKPEKLVLHVCTLTPQRVVNQVLKDLEGIPQSSPEVVRSGRQALECSFPTDRERGGRGA
ncbi:MAG: hypothetical protein SF172_14965 [Burkholderiales bacterium]|nr:hypothetical protein [Burkholderiales bacterium]